MVHLIRSHQNKNWRQEKILASTVFRKSLKYRIATNTVEPQIVDSPKQGHSIINLSTKDMTYGPRIIPIYNAF